VIRAPHVSIATNEKLHKYGNLAVLTRLHPRNNRKTRRGGTERGGVVEAEAKEGKRSEAEEKEVDGTEDDDAEESR